MCRKIKDLETVTYSKNPWAFRKSRPRGKKRAGLVYQRLLGEDFARRGLDYANGPWLEFYDANGRGFAQPDFIVYKDPKQWLVVEAKLSQTPAAFEQLFSLYVPLLKYLHPEIELIPIQVCKYLRTEGKYFEDVLKTEAGGTCHWIA